MFGSLRNNIGIARNSTGSHLHSMHKIESRETSNRKYLSKTILNGKPKKSLNEKCWYIIWCWNEYHDCMIQIWTSRVTWWSLRSSTKRLYTQILLILLRTSRRLSYSKNNLFLWQPFLLSLLNVGLPGQL